MKKNKKGFTLIELIICLAIVAALGVAAVFGLQNVLNKSQVNTYKNSLKEVATSTRIYLRTQKIESDSSERTVRLEDLVNTGTIDEEIYHKINGFTCQNFNSDVEIYHKETVGLKTIYMKDANNKNCNLEDLDNCNFKDDCK